MWALFLGLSTSAFFHSLQFSVEKGVTYILPTARIRLPSFFLGRVAILAFLAVLLQLPK